MTVVGASATMASISTKATQEAQNIQRCSPCKYLKLAVHQMMGLSIRQQLKATPSRHGQTLQHMPRQSRKRWRRYGHREKQFSSNRPRHFEADECDD